MNETDDRLRALLAEWQAPEPSSELDRRVLAAFRAPRQSLWRRLWTMRITIPAPALAALLLLLGAALWLLRPRLPAAPAPSDSTVVTQLDATGFRPLPNGAIRVVRGEER